MSDPFQEPAGRTPIVRDRKASVWPWAVGAAFAAVVLGFAVWTMSGQIGGGPPASTTGEADRTAPVTPPGNPSVPILPK
jgi:hypothetical protein